MVDADMEDYGFEYSDEEQEEQDVDIENQYYNSKGSFGLQYVFVSSISVATLILTHSLVLFLKGMVETEPEGALSGFAEVVKMEPEKAEW